MSRIKIGRVTSHWATRYWLWYGKQRYWFSLGCGLFYITVER